MMWRIMQIDEENAILLFISLFPAPETELLDAITAWKRGCYGKCHGIHGTKIARNFQIW